ncbi:hypothetical protein [Pseudodesulfovibrio alkaliphilus]|nr:hypothetical protein [Pseudodesulfovibrio alkaliphilus]
MLLAGSIAVLAFVVDSTRLTSDSAQLKHATDAAATATALAYARDKSTNVQEMAEQYVQANLGFSRSQVEPQLEVTVAPYSKDSYDGFRVSATYTAEPSMLGGNDRAVTVSSAAVAIYCPIELAMVLPNTSSESPADLAALSRLTKTLAERLIEDKPDRWMALVPYSQTVNVYDRDYPDRVTQWAETGALKPVELTSLFMSNNYGITSLASRAMPDLRVKRLAVYRGVHPGENYYWTESPIAGFKIHYRHDLPVNANWMPYISWKGPNPFFGKATGVADTRYIVGDKGCPTAALLPLTNNMDDIDARLNQMESGFNINYAIAMGWGAMALSPAFRGSAGWGDAERPLDFSGEENTNIKAIVMLGKTEGDWFDTDAYNSYVGEDAESVNTPIVIGDEIENDDDNEHDSGRDVYEAVRNRFLNLCGSFREHDIKFYFIGVRSGDPEDHGQHLFEQNAYPQLLTCTEDPDDISFVDNTSFVGAEGEIKSKLEAIASDLESQSSFVWLVE